MSEYRDYIEQNYDDILAEFQKYIIEINKVRTSFGLPHRQFTSQEKEEFERQYVEERSIWVNIQDMELATL